MAMSADGNLIVAVPVSNGQPQFGVYANGSWTWTSKGPTGSWWGVDVSPDGSKIVITSTTGYIYLSEDGGTTWVMKGTSRNWRGVKFIGNTKKFVAVVNSGQIYNSFSTPYISYPTSGLTLSSWSPVISWDRSVTCQYSFDNSTWSNASCVGNGSDMIPPSTSGYKTLYIKATDFEGVVSTSSVSFNYFATISNNNNINGCGKISSSGTYILTQDITNVPGVCLIINANDVIIDGAGYTISAAPNNNNYAITASSSQNLKLQNINFTGFNLGIASSTSSIEYSGNDVNISNSTTTAGSLKITYSNTLTAVNAYLSSLSNIIINGVDLWAFTTAGIFTWNQQDISNCMVISSPGYYRLTQDISNISGTCFDIQSKYVILDGNNHTLTAAGGNNSFAFTARNTFNTINKTGGIAIKNITISGFGGGIDGRSATVDADYINQFGSHGAVNGSNISLYNVNFPTNTVSVNLSGGNGSWNGSVLRGGDSGNIKVYNSTLGSIILRGGDTIVPQNLGTDIGIYNGGFAGSVTNVGSNIATTTSIGGLSAIPGCMNSQYFNYNENATYDNGNCTQGVIGVDIDNPIDNTILGPANFYMKSNHGIVNGDAYYYDHDVDSMIYGPSYNYGTTTGMAEFYLTGNGGGNRGFIGGGAYFENGNNESEGTINGNANFYYGQNYGIINGDVSFDGYGDSNSGTIYGSVVYTGYAGQNYGTINGNVDFTNGFSTNGNYNRGTINGDAIFYYTYENQGVVTGTITYYNGCLDSSASNYDANAIVYNDGYCEYIGSQQSNYDFVRGPITFTNGYHNYGTVNGDAVFQSGSYNFGTVNGTSTFFNTYNYSTVNGNAYFNDSQNIGPINGDAYFNNINTYGTGKLTVDGVNISDASWIANIQGNVYDADNNLIDTIEFINSTVNYNSLHLKTIFYDNTANYGTLYNDSVFNGYAVNEGAIVANNIVFNNQSINKGSLQSSNVIVFNDNSISMSGDIDANVKLNTTGYSLSTNTLPSSGVLKIESLDWNTQINGNIYDSNNSLINKYEFYYSTANNVNITGDTAFYDSSHNNGPISGDVIFATNYYGSMPTSTIMYVLNSSLNGNISGNILSSDGITNITDFIFRNSSSNNITLNGNAVFYDSSNNNGTINGNAVFNNTAPFVMGTINGSVTLNGLAQTINGINNIQNLTKNSSVRDVLYLSSGSTLNISGLLTLTGNDQNSLLTVRSMTPGSQANININGSSTLNYLRLKDIRNNSALVDLTNVTAFNDGGNYGFTFRVNSNPGSRGGITGSYTAPVLPPSRGGVVTTLPTPPTPINNTVNNTRSISGTLDRFINPNIRPLNFNPLQNFNLFNNKPNIGATVLPNPLSGLKAPTTLDLMKLPVNFLDNVSKFVLNSIIKNNKNNYSSALNQFLLRNNIDINREQDLAKITVKPLSVNINDGLNQDLFIVKNNQSVVNTNISYDPALKSLVQIIKIPSNTYINISSNKVKNIRYMNKNFAVNGNIDVLSEGKSGKYVIQSTNIPLVLDVYEPIKETKTNKGVWQWIKGLFGK